MVNPSVPAEELEIKLSILPTAVPQIRSVLAAQPECEDRGSAALRNLYFDSNDYALNRARAALRVRQKGERFIQTLKTQGEFVGTGHRRTEWEWSVPSAALELELLKDTPIIQALSLQKLHPVFETNFQRNIVMIRESTETLIEVALDQGEIRSGDRVRDLCEVEFELKAGNASRLLAWAAWLADRVPVFLNLISKAEQGYALSGFLSENQSLVGGTDSRNELGLLGFLDLLSRAWLKDEAVSLEDYSLGTLKTLADKAGIAELFSKVTTDLNQGSRVVQLMSSTELGQVQLALIEADFTASQEHPG